MKTIFTKDEILQNVGSYSKENVLELLRDKSEFTIDEILSLNITLKYKAWFISNRCEFTKDELTKFAIGCAYCVLPIYEAKYPENKAPRESIEAAEQYLAGTISIDPLDEKSRARASARASALEAAYNTAVDAAVSARFAYNTAVDCDAYAAAEYYAADSNVYDAASRAAMAVMAAVGASASASADYAGYAGAYAATAAEASASASAYIFDYAGLVAAYNFSHAVAVDYSNYAAAAASAAYSDSLLHFFRSLFKETI
jgi:hypothetical protein